MQGHIAHSGAWGLAVIMIVVASWLLYRYLAPSSWREWASAGIVQAFIIALYAEMYGFPLTIYLLARFFGLDKHNLNANLSSSLLGLGETGMMVSMLLGYALLFVGVGIFIQGWRELYRARQQSRLVVTGLYGLVRHAQYTGLFIGLFGEGVVHWPTIFSIGLFPVIVAVYTLLARSEEKKMIEQFGYKYRAYRKDVPMFFPRTGQWRQLVKPASGTDDSDARVNRLTVDSGSEVRHESDQQSGRGISSLATAVGLLYGACGVMVAFAPAALGTARGLSTSVLAQAASPMSLLGVLTVMVYVRFRGGLWVCACAHPLRRIVIPLRRPHMQFAGSRVAATTYLGPGSCLPASRANDRVVMSRRVDRYAFPLVRPTRGARAFQTGHQSADEGSVQ